jgi:hypothetical protein
MLSFMMLSKLSLSVGFGLLAVALAACDSTVETDEAEDGGGGTTSATTSGGPTTTAGTTTGSSTTGSSSGQTTGAGGDGGSGQGGEGEGGRAAQICAAMEEITLGGAFIFDAGGDAVWEAGEQASLRVTMTNLSPNDNTWYPGVNVTTDNPMVSVLGNTLFAILGSSSTEVEVVGQADPSVPPGTEVELTFHANALNHDCEGLATTTLVVTIE